MTTPTSSSEHAAPQSISDQPVGDYLAQLAAKVPAPGGGAVAALHAAQAAALVAMVARYTTRAKDAEHRPTIDSIIGSADGSRARALALAAADAKAFTAVGAAYRLPHTTDAETAARHQAVTSALVGAAEVPAQVVSVAADILALATDLLPIANPNVVTDIGAAAHAVRAAATSSQLNIAINVAALDDESGAQFTAALQAIAEIVTKADALHTRILEQVS